MLVPVRLLFVGKHGETLVFLNTSGIWFACAGFKLDTLLKLADVKGVDRKTSLLHFVLDQLLKESATLASLSAQLKSVRPAANLQVPSLSKVCSGTSQ